MQIPPSIIIVVPNVENNFIIAKKASKASMDSRIFPFFFRFSSGGPPLPDISAKNRNSHLAAFAAFVLY
jgi:hypothetical protein